MIKSDDTYFHFPDFKIKRIDLHNKYKEIEREGNLSNGLVSKTLKNERNNPLTIKTIGEIIKKILPDKIILTITKETVSSSNRRIPISHKAIN